MRYCWFDYGFVTNFSYNPMIIRCISILMAGLYAVLGFELAALLEKITLFK